jgi:hypothetical protein
VRQESLGKEEAETQQENKGTKRIRGRNGMPRR